MVYCGILLSIVAVSVDITLPFFAAMAGDLDASIHSMRATVTLYFVFIGLGHLIFGPLADRLGRRPALAMGLALFFCGSLISGFAQNRDVMMLGRVFQGLGAAAGPVVARAILRDLFTGPELARKMAIAMSIFSLGPIVGPLIGVGLVTLGGSWRFIFYGMAFYVAVLLLLLVRIPESLSRRQPDALTLSRLRDNTLRVFRHPQSRHFIITNAIMVTSMLLIVSMSPILYEHEYGLTGAAFAYLFALHGLGIVVGQYINHWLIGVIGVLASTMAAAVVTLVAGTLIAVLAASDLLHAYGLTALVTFFAIGFLCVISNTSSLVMSPHGDIAGFTSSLQGASAQTFAGVTAWLLGTAIGVEMTLWGVSLAGISAVVLLLLWRWQVNPARDAT